MTEKERIKSLMESLELTKTGYAGLDKDGNKVDRRKFPKSVPFAKSTPLNIPHPRCIKCGNEVEATYLIESLCPKCRTELQNPAVSDTTGDEVSNADGNQKTTGE